MPEDMQWLPVLDEQDVRLDVQRPLYRAWRAVFERVGRPPTRGEFGFEEFRPWLGWLSIYNVAVLPPQIALWGTELAASAGRDFTNMPVADETFGSQTASVVAAMQSVIAERRPVQISGTLAWCGRHWRGTDGLMLPFGDGAAQVTRIVALCTHRKLRADPAGISPATLKRTLVTS